MRSAECRDREVFSPVVLILRARRKITGAEMVSKFRVLAIRFTQYPRASPPFGLLPDCTEAILANPGFAEIQNWKNGLGFVTETLLSQGFNLHELVYQARVAVGALPVGTLPRADRLGEKLWHLAGF
jgi:hypothetical protein